LGLYRRRSRVCEAMARRILAFGLGRVTRVHAAHERVGARCGIVADRGGAGGCEPVLRRGDKRARGQR